VGPRCFFKVSIETDPDTVLIAAYSGQSDTYSLTNPNRSTLFIKTT